MYANRVLGEVSAPRWDDHWGDRHRDRDHRDRDRDDRDRDRHDWEC
jgi:hypothetical protein